MPRLTKAQRAELEQQDAQIIARTNAWQRAIDAGEVEPVAECMRLMQDGLRALYPEEVAGNPSIVNTHLQALYPHVNDPEHMFEVISEKLAAMDEAEFATLMLEPVFAFSMHDGTHDLYTQLGSINNYFGILKAARADHLEWINVYKSRYEELRKVWWKAATVRSDQRYALMFAFATSVYIICRPAVFTENFYRFVFSLPEPAKGSAHLHIADREFDRIFRDYYEENKVGTSGARGLAEIELSVQLLRNFFTRYPDVIERLRNQD